MNEVRDARPSAGADAGGRRARWWLAVPAVVVSAALAAAMLVLWHDRARVRVSTTVVRTTPSAVVLRPGDCPLDANCFTGVADPTVVSAVRRHFPGSAPVDDWRLIHGVNGSTVRDSVRVRAADGTLVALTSRCVRNGAPVADHPIDAGVAQGPARVFAIVAGAAGCSVGVLLDVPPGVAVDRRAAEALAHDPAVQVRD